MRVALKSVNGVDSVNVSLNKGLATATLKPGNAVRMKQLLDAIAKNGFTTKQSKLVVDGVVVSEAGGLKLKVSGSDENFALTGDAPLLEKAKGFVGKKVMVDGTIPEVVKGKTADTIRLNSIDLAKE